MEDPIQPIHTTPPNVQQSLQVPHVKIPSFFWEGIFTDQPNEYPDPALAKQFQQVADQARSIIESTNQRIKAISKDPNSNDSQKQIQFAKQLGRAEKELNDHLSKSTLRLMEELKTLDSEINQAMNYEATGLNGVEIRGLLKGMNQRDKSAFIREAIKIGDASILGAIAGSSHLRSGLDPDLHLEAAEGFKSTKFPMEYEKATQLRQALNSFKRGAVAVSGDLDTTRYKRTVEQAAAAQKAMDS